MSITNFIICLYVLSAIFLCICISQCLLYLLMQSVSVFLKRVRVHTRIVLLLRRFKSAIRALPSHYRPFQLLALSQTRVASRDRIWRHTRIENKKATIVFISGFSCCFNVSMCFIYFLELRKSTYSKTMIICFNLQ